MSLSLLSGSKFIGGKLSGGNREGTVKTGLNRNIPCKMVEATLALSFIAQDVRNAKKE